MYCKHCGNIIDEDCIICPKCGKQVNNLKQEQPNIIINNNNSNINTNQAINNDTIIQTGKLKNKWVALFLCIFFGLFGAHKFYEGKVGTGIIYIFTFGLFFIGWFSDIVSLLGKPNPYYI